MLNAVQNAGVGVAVWVPKSAGTSDLYFCLSFPFVKSHQCHVLISGGFGVNSFSRFWIINVLALLIRALASEKLSCFVNIRTVVTLKSSAP